LLKFTVPLDVIEELFGVVNDAARRGMSPYRDTNDVTQHRTSPMRWCSS